MSELTRDEIELLHSMFDLAREGEADELADWIDRGIPANLTNPAGDTLLMLGAYYRQPRVVEVLLARGADTERANDRGQTPLGAAVFRQDEQVARLLLSAGADPDGGPRSARSLADFFGLDRMTALLDGEDPGPEQAPADAAEGAPEAAPTPTSAEG